MAGEAEEAVVKAEELRCENCGAPWEMRGFKNTHTVACEHCGSVFDTSGQSWQLVQRVEGAYKAKPRYALGTRGKLDGVEWEVIGWAQRSVRSWGMKYTWEEHLLFNPYEGFRYLIFQDGHWVTVTQLPGCPSTGINMARYSGQTFKHFSTADATVDEVLGEFPWEIRRGDVATATDYVDPPQIMSSEESRGEVVWSRGRYLQLAEVVAAFGEPTRKCRSPSGIHPCQPNPDKALAGWMLKAALIGVGVWALMSMIYVSSRDQSLIWSGPVGSQGVSVPVRIVDGPHLGTVEIEGRANVSNNWVFLGCAFINEHTEKASFVPLEISYYHGRSGGESWSEGSRSSSTIVSSVPRGDYVLQITPDPRSKYKGTVDVRVLRDVPLYRYVCCTFILLILVPAFVFARSRAFESKRWSESDHAS